MNTTKRSCEKAAADVLGTLMYFTFDPELENMEEWPKNGFCKIRLNFAKLRSSLCLRNQKVILDLLLPGQAVQLMSGCTTRIQLFQPG